MPIEWNDVKRVLIVKLRSIGDTVLATPSLIALRKFAPHVEIEILLEDWVAPLLVGFECVDRVIPVGSGTAARIRTAWELNRRNYDAVFNLHGGTTATFFTAATRARHRIGFAKYQYGFLYTDLLSSASDFWGKEFTHSAEQQLALLGHTGVPVHDRPGTHLSVTAEAKASIDAQLADTQGEIALLHPATAFATKQWAATKYARVAEHLASQGFTVATVASAGEKGVLDEVMRESRAPIKAFWSLALPEITALAARSAIFVGNDSGIAHIAAAVGTPTVVIFGSSNRRHWHPWTQAPNEMVFNEMPCQPCSGYRCQVFGEPKCILEIDAEQVTSAIDRVLNEKRRALMPA